jgi:hypothetical protein
MVGALFVYVEEGRLAENVSLCCGETRFLLLCQWTFAGVLVDTFCSYGWRDNALFLKKNNK